MEEKLRKAIERYLATEDFKKKSAAKGTITKIINGRAAKIGAIAARAEAWKTLKAFNSEFLDWLNQRLTPGSFYNEKGRIMGWYIDSQHQAQAEELPLDYSRKIYTVTFYQKQKERRLWNQRGFEVAEDLPVVWCNSGGFVEFGVERSPFWMEFNYALPCSLQWFWEDKQGLIVTRSIIPHGYWQAWKWWPEAQWWYLEKRPELFADMNWWEEPEPEPQPDPYAAVLGGMEDQE